MKCLILLTLVCAAFAGSLHSVPEGRISGGENAKDDDFPYQVSVRAMGFHVCSGLIITPDWVLTAQSCVVGVPEKLLSIHYGTTDRTLGGIFVDAEKVVGAPNFNKDNLLNDLALIKTASSLDCNVYKYPAPLATTKDVIYDDIAVLMSGWGYLGTSSGQLSAKLRKVNSNVFNIETCSDNYKGIVTINKELPAQICIGDIEEGVLSLCHGDAGGPVIGVKAPFQKVFGVGSFSKGCGNEKDHPSVFTLVAPNRGWIRDVTGLPVDQ